MSLRLGHAVAGANGHRHVDGVDIVSFDPARPSAASVNARLPCDLLLVSGGWTPTLHLLAQRGSKPVFDALAVGDFYKYDRKTARKRPYAVTVRLTPDEFEQVKAAPGELRRVQP